VPLLSFVFSFGQEDKFAKPAGARSMNFTLLTQYYPPEIGAPQARLSYLAREFCKAGHRVTVLTAMPNYPTGRIFNGYGHWLKRERRDEDQVEVLRSFIYPAQSAALIPRLTSYFSFVGSSALVGSFLLQPCDYLLVESPPLFLGLAGVWLSRLKRARLIFNVSDLWPESAVRLGVIGRESCLHRWARSLEALCYRKAWLVTGQSREILADIDSRFPGLHTRLLSNGADTEMFRPSRRTDESPSRLTEDGEFVALYAGLHGLAQGLNQVLDAARLLEREGGYRFVLVGDGPQKRDLVRRAHKTGRLPVTFLDPLPAAYVPALLAAADVVLVPLSAKIPGAVPSKLYEAMASGCPVVIAAEGEAADIVRGHDAGIVIPPGDGQALARAVRKLKADPNRAQAMGGNGRCAAVRHYDRGEITRDFLEYLETQMLPSPAVMDERYEAPLGI
jgi:glycosyltransferase involved in cell wall biosynthesis